MLLSVGYYIIVCWFFNVIVCWFLNVIVCWIFNLYFCGGTLTTNRRPLAVSVVCHLGAVSQQFDVGPDRFVVHNVFLSVF